MSETNQVKRDVMRILNKTDTKTIKHALMLAIAWEQSVLDSYFVELKSVNGLLQSCIPKELKKEAAQTKRSISTFEKILSKLNNVELTHERSELV